jgi:hypothetical protein
MNRTEKSTPWRASSRNSRSFAALLLTLVFTILACSFSGGGGNPSLDATRIALDVQSTVLAQKATELASQPQVSPEPALQEVSQNEPQAPTSTPPPTETPTQIPPTEIPSPTSEPPTPTQEPSATAIDLDAQIKAANILLFEDMSGTGKLRYIKEALDAAGYTYVDTGSAQGRFKDRLLSGEKWDLIIAGSESRSKIQGEFYTYLLDQLNQGVAVIIEMWNMDDIGGGKFANIAAKCGIRFQKDWYIPLDTQPLLSVWWLQPEHPILHEPNEGMSLRNFMNFWTLDTDKGDLFRLADGGDAVLLGGTIANEKSRYGTLAVCLDGRLILQTFSTHEYRQEEITLLWQNYIYNALKSRFAAAP